MADTPLIDIRPDHWQIIQRLLKKHLPEHEVWAFGSRATWKAKEYSDLDLAIITDKPLSLEISASLSNDFSESDLPWRVDVVDWATTSESFRKIIERDKVVVQKGKCLGVKCEWQTQHLSNLCAYLSRGSAPSYTETGGILVLNQKCIRAQRVDFSQARRTDCGKKSIAFERIIQPFDILINSTGTGTLGRVAQVCKIPEKTTIDSHVTLVRPDSKKVYPKYLGLALRYFEPEIEALGEGSTGQTELSRARLSSFCIPMPVGQDEQRAIAYILGAMDDKIELLHKQNETLEQMVGALFKAWFVDFEPVRAKLEGRWQRGQSLPGLPAYLYDFFPDRLVESELGEIPEGWDVSTLGAVCAYLNRGVSPKYIDLGGVLVLNQKCIRDFSIDFSKARRHDVTQKKVDGRALELGDVLVNSTGVGTLGRVAQVRCLAEITIVDSHVTVVRSGSRINPMFLGGFMSMKQPEIEAMGEGSTGQTELSRTKLGELKILLPTAGVLDHFSKHTKTFSENIAANQEDSETLAQLRDTLLPKLISGELRVPDVKSILGATI